MLTKSAKMLSGAEVNPEECALYVAVCEGNEKIVQSLLNQGVSVHSKVKGPFSCIHIAVEKGNLNIVKLLLNNKADVDARYPRKGDAEEGDSLLHHAVEKENEAIVKLLLNYNADVDIISSNGATPLHIAAERGLENIAELLVEAGADIRMVTTPSNTDYYLEKFRENEAIRDFLNLKTPHIQEILITDKGYSPLHVAVINSHENMVTFLLELGADVDEEDSDGNSVLHIAVEKGDPKIVDLILSYLPNVNAESNRGALYFAVQNCKTVYKIITEKLLQYGFNFVPVDAHNHELLFKAVSNNHVQIVDGFLKEGANVNKSYSEKEYDEPTLLHEAVQYDYEDMVKLLVHYGADVNVESKKKQTPLFYAVKNSNVDISRFLLDKGARVDDAHILITAVERNVLEIIEDVISKGANVDRSVDFDSESFKLPETYKPFDLWYSSKPNSKTALFIAAEEGYEEAVKLLVSKGSMLAFSRTNHDLNPLLISVINGHLNVISVLLKSGAQVDSFDSAGRTALHLAAEMGHVDVVKLLLRYDAMVDCRTRSDMTPFHFACMIGNLEIADLLLKFGANIHAINHNGITSLYVAAAYGHHEMVKFLLDHGAVLDSQDSEGFTPLLISAEAGHVKCVDVLLKHGANIDHTNVNGSTALHRASIKACVNTVKLLLEHGAKINCKTNTGDSPLHFAAGNNTPDIVEVLLKQGANPNTSNDEHFSPLYAASTIGNLETVKLLLLHGAKADPAYKFNDQDSPLWVSTNQNHIQIVDALVKISTNSDECVTAFCTAARKGHDKVMEALLDKVDPNDPEIRDEVAVFLDCAIEGNIKVIETLLARGSNVNTANLDGKTALHFSAENGNLEIVKLLLNNGAGVDTKTNEGETPFLFAAAEGHLNILEILLERGANVDSADNLNRTSLYYAAEYGHEKAVNLLLEAGANVNPEVESKTRKTPLLIAAERDHSEIVKILLQHGSRADSQDTDGLTALYFAVEFGHEKIIELLLKNGASIDCQTRNGLPLILIAAQRGHLRSLEILLKFGVDLDLFGKPALEKYFLDKIPKWKPQVFECILDFIFISRDYGYAEPKDLCEYYISPLFTILNKVDVPFQREAEALNYHKVAETLVHHFEKMKAASIYPGGRNLTLQVYSDENRISDFHTRCVVEVGNMKSAFIRNSNVSLYHILVGSFSQLSIHAKNSLIIEYFASVDLNIDFPVYSNIIKGQFQKGIMGKELQDKATEVLLCSSLFKNFPPDRDPTVIIEIIVRYLNIKDLKNVVAALPCSHNVAEL